MNRTILAGLLVVFIGAHVFVTMRDQRAALSRRRGGIKTVPFSMFGIDRRQPGFAREMHQFGFMTVPFMTIFGTVEVYHTQARVRDECGTVSAGMH